MNKYDITKVTVFNPKIQATNPVSVRVVKVKTIGDLSSKDIKKIMYENSVNGWQPAWEEVEENDVAELDTVSLFKQPNGEFFHQTTLPIPVDKFPKVIGMSVEQITDFTIAICKREGWNWDFGNIMCVLNNLSMEL